MISGSQLISFLKKGDHKAMEDIYSLYWEEVLDSAYKRLRDEEVAQDITQEIFISLWENREKIQLTGTLRAYLEGAVKYRVINYFRSSAIKEKHKEDLSLLLRDDLEHSAENRLILKDLHQEVDEAMLDLPEKMRLIFSMSRKQEKSIGEISDELGLSAQTVKNQLSAALKVMRKRLSYLLLLIICILFT